MVIFILQIRKMRVWIISLEPRVVFRNTEKLMKFVWEPHQKGKNSRLSLKTPGSRLRPLIYFLDYLLCYIPLVSTANNIYNV